MKVAVVGSGIGGLLTASLLRERGIDVVRYEKSGEGGGRARSPELGGLPVNLGPHALYRGGPLDKALASLGIRPQGFAPPTQGILGVVDGALAVIPGSLPELLASTLLRGADKRVLALVLARVAVGALDVDADEPIGSWLDRHAGAGRARDLLAMLVRVGTYSDDPGQDARLALLQLRSALTKGVTYVDGGWRSIVDALTERAGPARTEAVRSLADLADLHDDGGADAVVIATGFDEAAALAGKTFGLARAPAPTPVTASCLDVVLTKLPKPERRVAFGVREPLYFSVHTRAGGRRDTAATPVIVHAMQNGAGAGARAPLEGLLDLVQPAWRDFLVDARYLSRMVVSSSLPRAGVKRVPMRLDERTFLVGDYVDAGALLADNAAASAAHAVEAVAALSRSGAERRRRPQAANVSGSGAEAA